MARTFEKDLAKLWEATSNKLINRALVVDQLEEIFRTHGVAKEGLIIDAAGGFGFPVIDLAIRGYQITYNDGSRSMLETAMHNAELAKAPAYIFAFQQMGYNAVPWQEFSNSYGEGAFNALICRGNSLPYAVSWGKSKPDLSKAREQIKLTLDQFFRVLEKGGIIYVDKQPEEQDQALEEVGEVEIDGRKYHLTCSFDNDKVNRIRNWTLSTKDLETGEVKDYPSQGYLLLEDELVPLLQEVGFKDVTKHVLKGDIYEGFVGVK